MPVRRGTWRRARSSCRTVRRTSHSKYCGRSREGRMDTFPEGFAWAILLLPVASCVVITLGLRRWARLSGYLTILCIFVAFLFSLWALKAVDAHHGQPVGYAAHDWL